MASRRALAALAVLVAGCQPNTTRPPFTPMPEAAATEIRLAPQQAAARLAEALEAEAIPVRLRAQDAYLESPWLDSASSQPTDRRPLGTGVVKIRAWADPGRPGNSVVIVETLYRPVADPSLPERELERQVPREHPIALKVEQTLEALVKRYGGTPKPAPPPAAPAPRRPRTEAS